MNISPQLIWPKKSADPPAPPPSAVHRFLCLLVVLLSALAILLALSLLLLIIFKFGPSGQQAEESLAFLNGERSWHDNCQRKCTANFAVPPLLVISFDGFRADYLQRAMTPAVSRVLQCGSRAEYLLPSYPSKTFPNHYTLLTGLYPESHGIVDNLFFDEQMPEGQKFFSKATQDPAWYKGEPLWNTVAKNGKKSAVFFWPGSEVPNQGILPTYKVHYNSSLPFSMRVDKMIRWLQLDEAERPSFLAMYFEQPDKAMHAEGPHSDAVNSALIYVDAMLNYLVQQLDNHGLLGCLNLVILSDHGAKELHEDLFVKMDQFVEAKDPQIGAVIAGIPGHVNFLMNASKDQPQIIEKVLASMSCLGGHQFRVYSAENMPIRYHYTRGNRIGQILLDPVAGAKLFENGLSLNRTRSWGKGEHGYDNAMPEMRTIFGAWGPSLKSGWEERPFQNVELYNLFTTLMELPIVAPNNGTFGRLHSLLLQPPSAIGSTPIAELSICQMANGNESCAPADAKFCNFVDRPVIARDLANQAGHCFVPLCNSTLVLNRVNQLANYIESQLDSSQIAGTHAASVNANGESTLMSLFPAENDCVLPGSQIWVPSGFYNGAWRDMRVLLRKYVRHFGRLLVWTGPIFDNDHDGLADSSSSLKKASHIFVIVFRCQNNVWQGNRRHCEQSTEAKTLAFVLPLLEKDLNCLPPAEYLHQHRTSIRDIELLTGNEWFMEREEYPAHLAILLRTQLAEGLWQLD